MMTLPQLAVYLNLKSLDAAWKRAVKNRWPVTIDVVRGVLITVPNDATPAEKGG